MENIAPVFEKTHRNISLWIGATSDAKKYKQLKGNQGEYDVVVVGGGITGISVAVRLKEAGKRVALIEAGFLGTGVSGYSTAKVTSLHSISYTTVQSKFGSDGARQYAMMNQAGLNLIADNVKKYNIECDLERRSAYTYTKEKDQVELIKKEVEACVEAGLDASFVVTSDLPFEIAGAVKVLNQAQFNPYKYVVGLAERFDDGKNCVVFEQSRVLEISSDSPYTLKTAEGTIKAVNVVLATHLPILDRTGHFAVTKPERSYLMAYDLVENSKIPKDMYITIDEGSWSVRSYKQDSILIVGGMGHSMGEPIDHDHQNSFRAIDKYARQNFPVKSELYRWSAHDYMPADSIPYVGYATKATNHMFAATGYKKWGFTIGSAAGIIITELILGNKHPYPLVDASRWDIAKSAVGVAGIQVEVAKHFIGDRISQTFQTKDIEDLVSGEGHVCKYKGDTVGAYKDEHGHYHLVDLKCKHLGCRVVWNEAERSWDCPCHGSRYDYQGGILHGPTTLPLNTYTYSK